MTTSASGRSACRFGGFLSVILLVTMALLVAAPSTSEAKTQLWLYPVTDDPRAGGHVVTDGVFTLVVENRGTGNDDTAVDVSLVVAVNDKTLLGSVTLVWPDGEETIVSGDLQPGTPWLPCDGKYVSRRGVYPADYTTVSFLNTTDPADQIEPGGKVEIAVEVVGEDGLEVHFDAIAQGFKMKKEVAVCYGVVNPAGHGVTVILGDAVAAECPAVTINKSADPTGVDLYGEVVYTIEVVSSEDCDPLSGVVVTENIPTVSNGDVLVPAFTVVAVDPPPDDTPEDPITWTLMSDLGPGIPPAIFTVTVEFDQPLTDGHKIVNTACVTADGIEDPECSRAMVAVGEQANDNAGEIRSPGFWCKRIRFAIGGKHRATYTIEELEDFLLEINDGTETSDGSFVFSEHYEASTLKDARTILCKPRLAKSPADRLVRHLLTLWFNIVSERVDRDLRLDELCPGDEELPEDADGEMTVGDVVTGAEDELLAGEPDKALLKWWKNVIDFINNATVGPDCDD